MNQLIISILLLTSLMTSSIVVYSNSRALIFIIPSLLLSAWLSYFRSIFFFLLFFIFLPLSGLVGSLYKINGASVGLPVFYAGLFGVYLKLFVTNKLTLRDLFPSAHKVYVNAILFSMLIAMVWIFPVNQLNGIVAQSPWGHVKFANAIGWVLLAFAMSLSGPLLYERMHAIFDEYPKMTKIMRVLLLSFLSPLILGWLQYTHHTSLGLSPLFTTSGPPQYNATFLDPNSLGISAVIFFSICLGLIADCPRKIEYWLLGGALLFLVLISGSRSALILLCISIGVFSLFLIKKNLKVVLVCLFLFICGLILFHLDQKHRFAESSRFLETTNRIQKFFNGEISYKVLVANRSQLWWAGWVTFKHNPIWGVGLGTYLFRMPAYAYEIGPIFNDNCGSQYLQILAEQGLVGLFAFLFVIGSVLVKFIKLNQVSWLQKGAFAGLCGSLVSFFFGAHLNHFEVNLYFWLLMSVITYEHSERNPIRN